MAIRISLYANEETLKNFNEIKDKLKTNKSKLFRDMVQYFHKYKQFLKGGISLDLEKIKEKGVN